MRTKRPFVAEFTAKDKENLQELARMNGVPYGAFFSTSGKALIERVRPTARYTYFYRTDEPNKA